jgi:hypothetical protein
MMANQSPHVKDFGGAGAHRLHRLAHWEENCAESIPFRHDFRIGHQQDCDYNGSVVPQTLGAGFRRRAREPLPPIAREHSCTRPQLLASRPSVGPIRIPFWRTWEESSISSLSKIVRRSARRFG